MNWRKHEELQTRSQDGSVQMLRWPLALESHVGGVQPDLTLKGEEEADWSLAAVWRWATVGVIVHLQVMTVIDKEEGSKLGIQVKSRRE